MKCINSYIGPKHGKHIKCHGKHQHQYGDVYHDILYVYHDTKYTAIETDYRYTKTIAQKVTNQFHVCLHGEHQSKI